MRRATACVSLIALLFAGAAHSAQTQTLSHGRFRNLALHRPAGEVSEVVRLLSSTPSDPAAEEAAIALADRGAVVVVIDAQQFERELLADDADCDELSALSPRPRPARMNCKTCLSSKSRRGPPAWGRRRVLLIGYSQGADVLPFVINRLGDATRERVQLIALLSPGLAASFEFHLSNWTGGDEGHHPIRPEAQKLNATRTLCVYGEDDDKESLCPQLTPGVMRVQRLPGGHHFNGAYDEVAVLILAGARSTNDAR
jgi:type IV secretory pathway VirJ component